MKTQKNSVRRSLILSATALMISVAMLIGTTFAWFTDSVSSGKNKIVAGNLDVELEYKDGENWETVNQNTNVFKEDTLWEPGHVEYAVLKITNAGTLALKYKLAASVAGETAGINVNEEQFKLSEHMKYAVVEKDLSNSDRQTVLNEAGAGTTLSAANVSYAGNLLAGESNNSEVVTLVVWMPTDVGNVANYKTGTDAPTINLGVNLVATQDEHEEDSFGTDYDASADGTPDNGALWNGATIAQASATVTDGQETVIEATGVKASVPADSVKEENVSSLTLTAVQTSTPSDVEIGTTDTPLTFDVNLADQDGTTVTAKNGQFFTIDLELPQAVEVIGFKHHNDAFDKVNSKNDLNAVKQYYYDAATKTITFTTDSFSPFTVIYKMFSGGNGTEAAPYLIANAGDWAALNKFDFEKNQNCYFKQTEDITAGEPVSVAFAGTYDADNHTLRCSYKDTKTNYVTLFTSQGTAGHVTFKNANIQMSDSAVAIFEYTDWDTAYGFTVENVTFNSDNTEPLKVNSNNFGFVTVISPATPKNANQVASYEFKNITNNVSIENAGTCTGVFVGQGFYFESKANVTYENCVNNGNITSGEQAGYLHGNSAYAKMVDNTGSSITVTNCTNNGNLLAIKENGICAIAPTNNSNPSEISKQINSTELAGTGTYSVGGEIATSEITIKQDGNKFALTNAADGYTYKMVLNVQAKYYTKNGEAWNEQYTNQVDLKNFDNVYQANGQKNLIDIVPDASVTGKLNSFRAYDEKTAISKNVLTQDEANNLQYSDGYAIVVKDTSNYIIFKTTADCYINSQVTTLIYSYKDGHLAGSKTIKK